LKAEFSHVEIVINGGFTDLASVRAQFPHVDGVMLGRAAYREPMLLANLDRMIATDGGYDRLPPVRIAEVLRRYLRYAESEVLAGTPLKAMTRHLMGLFAHERGGRAWRRELSELPAGLAGLQRVRFLVDKQMQRACIDRVEAATMPHPTFQYS
jgi:tRNA-dihydrouridine synthase A